MTVGNCSFHSALHLLCISITHKGKSLKIAGVHLETQYLFHGPAHVPVPEVELHINCVYVLQQDTRNTVYQEVLY
jgi:hypothetical protein